MDNLIITNYRGGIATALFAEGKAVELSYDAPQQASVLHNIYVGKVVNIVKNINAAFIEIEDGVSCYYSLEDNPQPFYTKKGNSQRMAAGDELLVQVSRESVKTKAPTVTSAISLSGKYLVLTAGKTRISASSKLPPEKKAALTKQMECFSNSEYGWIVRTNAADVPAEMLISEAKRLQTRFVKIRETAQYRPCRACLYRSPAAWLSHLKDFYSAGYSRIITDDEAIFTQISDYLSEYQPEDLDKLTRYQDRLLPLAKLYSLEGAFEDALRERVWLKSGAYLVIQPTEALTAIDVNTGKYERGKKAQETYLKINLEAAREIARQIRLRGISGMILVDFINMASEAHKKELMRSFDTYLSADPAKACVVDMTALGLVEVTRKRVQKPLAEKMEKAGKLA